MKTYFYVEETVIPWGEQQEGPILVPCYKFRDCIIADNERIVRSDIDPEQFASLLEKAKQVGVLIAKPANVIYATDLGGILEEARLYRTRNIESESIDVPF